MNGFAIKTYNNVPIIVDRYPENSRTKALAIDAVRHPNGPRCRSLDHVWLSQLTPSNLSNLKVDFIPRVENPDPAQLERLKTMDGGELKDILRKFAEDALFTTKARVDIPNKREKK